MEGTLKTLGNQLTAGTQAAEPLANVPKRIICCGMGGSSVAGEFLSMVRPDIIVHWDWDLPKTASANDLVICTSWSGETHETLSSYDTARKLNIPVAVITTGGKLAEKAKADGVPLALLPTNAQPPRCNAFAMFGAMCSLLDMADQLPAIDAAAQETAGQKLAEVIGSNIPVFYAGYPWRKVAGLFVTTMNENAKRHAWAANFPSAAHNEIEGWGCGCTTNVVAACIHDSAERPHDARYREALVALLTKKGYTVSIVDLVGATALEKALTAYATALWASWHVAKASGMDPKSTQWIDEFKEITK